MACVLQCNACGFGYEARDSVGCPACSDVLRQVRPVPDPDLHTPKILRSMRAVVAVQSDPGSELVTLRLACGHTLAMYTDADSRVVTARVECVRCELHAILRG